jgi:hypothetical protein
LKSLRDRFENRCAIALKSLRNRFFEVITHPSKQSLGDRYQSL